LILSFQELAENSTSKSHSNSLYSVESPFALLVKGGVYCLNRLVRVRRAKRK